MVILAGYFGRVQTLSGFRRILHNVEVLYNQAVDVTLLMQLKN